MYLFIHIGRNIHIYLIYNVIYKNLLLNLINVGKVSRKIDFQENEVMPLLHGALQLYFVVYKVGLIYYGECR